ncbi:MAG: DUF6438 domain-containing protein [Flavobacteriales bacterium]
MRIFGIILLLVVSMGACKRTTGVQDSDFSETPVTAAPAPSAADGDSLAYYYERTACFGQCPIFKLSIYASGYAIYEGKNYVNNIGTYHSFIDVAALLKINEAANSIGYFGLQSVYDDPNKLDVPSKITIIRQGDQKISVTNRVKGPKSLEVLYSAFDDVIATATWKPKS